VAARLHADPGGPHCTPSRGCDESKSGPAAGLIEKEQCDLPLPLPSSGGSRRCVGRRGLRGRTPYAHRVLPLRKCEPKHGQMDCFREETFSEVKSGRGFRERAEAAIETSRICFRERGGGLAHAPPARGRRCCGGFRRRLGRVRHRAGVGAVVWARDATAFSIRARAAALLVLPAAPARTRSVTSHLGCSARTNRRPRSVERLDYLHQSVLLVQDPGSLPGLV
jgi:hypothetical protein